MCNSVGNLIIIIIYIYIYIYYYYYIYIYMSLLLCNCACSLEYSSLSTLAGLSYHICGKLEVAFKALPSSLHFRVSCSRTHQTEILSDECVSTKLGVTENFVSSLYLLLIYIYIYIYIYTCNRVANAVKTVLNTLCSIEL